MPNVTYAATANTIEAPTYKQLDDAMMLQREVLKSTIADTIDMAPFTTMLMLMAKGRTSRSKKPEWIAGDAESVRTTLVSADVVIDDASQGALTAASTGLVTLATATVPLYSLLYVYDTVHNIRAVLRYNGQGARATIVYASGTGTLHYSNDSVVYVLPTAMNWDGEAGLGVNFGGLFYNNAMMRVRESVERGPHTESDNMYMKRDLAEIARIKYIGIQQQLEQLLMTSTDKAINTTSFERLGVMGGLDYFLRPWIMDGTYDSMKDILGVQSTAANASADVVSRGKGMRGWTKLISGDTIDFDTCEAIMADARVYGSSERHIFCPPKVARKFTKMARNEKVLFAADYAFPNFPNIIVKVPAFETAFGTIYIHADYSASGIYKYVTDGTNYIAGTDWAYFLDMSQFDWITHDVPNKGVQTLSLKPVKLDDNNNTIEKAEWDGTFTLAKFDSRPSGIVIFGTPAGV